MKVCARVLKNNEILDQLTAGNLPEGFAFIRILRYIPGGQFFGLYFVVLAAPVVFSCVSVHFDGIRRETILGYGIVFQLGKHR